MFVACDATCFVQGQIFEYDIFAWNLQWCQTSKYRVACFINIYIYRERERERERERAAWEDWCKSIINIDQEIKIDKKIAGYISY